MRKLEEKRELLYVIRTMDVLMSSGLVSKRPFTPLAVAAMGLFPRIFLP